jgi:hypothetical protein
MPIAAVATLEAVLAFELTQQHLTVTANDPQGQMAEHAVARLDSGTDARSIVPAKTVDIVSSLDPYLVVFDRARHVLASTATLRGGTPDFPDGLAVAAQSMRLTEEREGDVRLIAIVGWFGSLSATALAAVVVGVGHSLPSRAPAPASDPGGPGGPSSETSTETGRGQQRHRHRRQLLSPPRPQTSIPSEQPLRSSRSADRRCCTSQAGWQGSATRRWGTSWRR